VGPPRIVRVAERAFKVSLAREGGVLVAHVEGESGVRSRFRLEPGRTGRLLLDGRPLEYTLARTGRGSAVVRVAGTDWPVEILEAAEAAIAASGGRAPASHPLRLAVRAPMPGRVLAVEVAEGDDVEAGRGLFIVEAMKMENEIRAPRAGRVANLAVREGEPVEQDQPLCELVAGAPSSPVTRRGAGP
jgi:biotin carboxyl carrier protein